MSHRRRARVRAYSAIAGLAIAAVVVWLVLRSRGGVLYELRFASEFSDRDGLALIAAAVIGALLLAGPRWALGLLATFGVLVMVFGVTHPCRIAAQATVHPDSCSVSATASALGLYLPLSALVCIVARWLARRAALSTAMAAALLGVSGVGLVVSLWLPWYDATDEGRLYRQTGWQSFQRFDTYVVIVGATACILALATGLAARRDAHRLGPPIALLALTGAGLSFYRLFTTGDTPSGGFLPLAGAYVMLTGFVATSFFALAVERAGARAAGD